MDGQHDHEDLIAVKASIPILATELTTQQDEIAALRDALLDHETRLKALEVPVPPPPPPPPPLPPADSPFQVGVVLVQNETDAGYARSKELPVRGQHYSQFKSNSGDPVTGKTDAGTWVDKSQASELYDAIAPQVLDVNNVAYGGSNSRCKDTPEVQRMAQLALDLAAIRPFVTAMNFWNELKGYYGGKKPDGSSTPGGWDTSRYCRDYITWATIIKAARPDIKLGGPYSTGQHGQNVVAGMDERVAYIHQAFIDTVVKPHPELVDYIAWDDADGSAFGAYTNFYKTRGVLLPHVDTEWYPLPTTAAKIALDMACDPLMSRVMFWGGGSDAAEKAPLWSSTGVGTVTLAAMKTVNDFAAHRPVTLIGSSKYQNAIGQVATVSGTGVTVV